MAALPCVLVTHALAHDRLARRGALTAYELLGADSLLEGLVAEGSELLVD
jgi:hypothetical protein